MVATKPNIDPHPLLRMKLPHLLKASCDKIKQSKEVNQRLIFLQANLVGKSDNIWPIGMVTDNCRRDRRTVYLVNCCCKLTKQIVGCLISHQDLYNIQ